ncbi:beta-1,3-glucosyltransferase isoform X2 [Macrobrachium rosenbergii]|uniref:beta-1,3-glucosyltransferase isoform X2 n=1 Tax=Macrobrachium rosenbergii TaxID=79674 RepID=UPI0034D3F221
MPFSERSCERGYIFVILHQQHPRHSAASQQLADDIAHQSKQLSLECHIYKMEEEWPNIASWTYYPIIERIYQLHGGNDSWTVIVEEWSQVKLEILQQVLMKYKSSEPLFLGNAVHDATETIIHHFDLVDEKEPFLFPDSRSGLVLSSALIESLAKKWSDKSLRPKVDFTIDAQYEFARFIESDGVVLSHHDCFCLEDRPDCAVVFSPDQLCDAVFATDDIHFAVKTCSQFHRERLPVLKETWLKQASNYALYSDVNDPSIGTVSLGIPNTERGHCAKTMAIIQHAVKITSMLWLAIVDDDTLLSVPRLKSLLSCYNPQDLIAIGERYGFHALGPYGYDYITGGGGMILSRALVENLAEPGVCDCPTNDTPDDMFLGVCLKRLSVPVIHSETFHQGRPVDYPAQLLSPELPVSFHKFWMVNPLEVYEEWLEDSHVSRHHEEL